VSECCDGCVTDKQWLQLDIGPPTLVTGMVTRGRGDTRRKHWVTRFRLSHSNDSQHWTVYKDATHLRPKVAAALSIHYSNLRLLNGHNSNSRDAALPWPVQHRPCKCLVHASLTE